MPIAPIDTAAAPAIAIEHSLIFRLVRTTFDSQEVLCVRTAPITIATDGARA
jgi:hypothetical protein